MNHHKTRRFAAIVICAGLFGAALPATASASTTGTAKADQSEQSRAQRADKKPEQKICVRERFTGSHLTRTICHTAAEWEARGGYSE